jgi:hypothetical protein
MLAARNYFPPFNLSDLLFSFMVSAICIIFFKMLTVERLLNLKQSSFFEISIILIKTTFLVNSKRATNLIAF